VPFKLDSLAGLPCYVFPSSFQSVWDDKSGYDHLLLSLESRPYFGFEWGGWYFASSTIPFGWKASAYIYHSIGLLASHYFRSLHATSSLYIDDRHTGEIQLSPLVPAYASISSALAKSLARANSAIFIICFTVITLRYFLGIKKSILVPRQIVPFLGFLVGSIRQSGWLYSPILLLIEEKKQKLRRRSRNSFPFYMLFLTPLLLLSRHFIVYRASVYRFLWQFRELVFSLTRCIMLLA